MNLSSHKSNKCILSDMFIYKFETKFLHQFFEVSILFWMNLIISEYNIHLVKT